MTISINLAVLLGLLTSVAGCSNVLLPSNDLDLVVHGRTMDLGSWTSFGFVSSPPTSGEDLGYLGVYPKGRAVDFGIEKGVAAGMNTAGLSCDEQTLIGTMYPPQPGKGDPRNGVLNAFVCEWALKSFKGEYNVNPKLPNSPTKPSLI